MRPGGFPARAERRHPSACLERGEVHAVVDHIQVGRPRKGPATPPSMAITASPQRDRQARMSAAPQPQMAVRQACRGSATRLSPRKDARPGRQQQIAFVQMHHGGMFFPDQPGDYPCVGQPPCANSRASIAQRIRCKCRSPHARTCRSGPGRPALRLRRTARPLRPRAEHHGPKPLPIQARRS